MIKNLMFVALFLVSNLLQAAEFAIKITDGKGQPLSGVEVKIYWFDARSEEDMQQIDLLTVYSDKDGFVSGYYDDASMPKGETVSVELDKAGYGGYSSTNLLPTFTMRREFHADDVIRIAGLEGDIQLEELKELLVGDYEGDPPLFELVFLHHRQLRPPLRALLGDTLYGPLASPLLSFIGFPEDLQAIIKNMPPREKKFFANRWTYYVVTALLEPTTEEEWGFIEDCALNYYDDRWVDAGAIMALGLIGSPRAVEILEKVRDQNTSRSQMTSKFIDDIIANGIPSLSDISLIEAGKKAAEAIKISGWQGNEQPRYDEQKELALIDIRFIIGRDLLVYTATFHKIDKLWVLRGIRETMQALLAIHEPETGSDEGEGEGEGESESKAETENQQCD